MQFSNLIFVRDCFAHTIFATSFFQLYCGILLATQPFLIAGIEDYDTAKSSAFGAAGMFVFTFLASMGAMWYDSMYKKEPVNGEVSDEAEYHLSQDTPASYGTAS